VTLGHELNCKIIAEGVESADEASMLHDLGIRHVQGYLFARPMPAQDLNTFLTAQDAAPKP
jgi:EAL domain-containing protein (putative c-di-GMP-specific phosphodiesterase class I)